MVSQEKNLEQVKKILNQVPCGMGLFDITTFETIFLNDCYYRIMGSNGKNGESEINHIIKNLVKNFSGYKQEQNSFTGNQKNIIKGYKYNATRIDGSVVSMELDLSVVNYFETIYISASFKEITEFENAIEFNKNNFDTVSADEHDVAIFEYNYQTGEFYKSPACKKYAISHFDNENVIDYKGISGAVHPDDILELQKFLRHIELGEEKVQTIIRAKMLDGSYRKCRAIAYNFKDQNYNLNKIIGIVIDLDKDYENRWLVNNLLDNIPIGVAVLKISDRIECQYYNQNCAKIVGRTMDELEDLNNSSNLVGATIATTDYESFINTIENSAYTRQQFNTVFRCITKSGDIKWIDMSAKKTSNVNGCPFFYCTFTPLSEGTKIYKSVVDDSDIGVIIAESKTNNIIYMNDATRKLCTILFDDIENGTKLNDVIKYDMFHLSEEQIKKLNEDSFTEFHVNSGKGIYFNIKARSLKWNSVPSYIMYITNEKEDYSRQHAFYNLIEHMPVGMSIFVVYQNQPILVFLNDSFYKILSTDKDYIPYKDINDYLNNVHSDDRSKLFEAISSISNDTDSFEIDYRNCIQGDSDKYVWLHMSARVVLSVNGGRVVCCCYTDISETLAAKKALEKNNEIIKKQFIEEQERRKILEKNSIVNCVINVTKEKITSFYCADNRFNDITHESDCKQALKIMLKGVPISEDKSKIEEVMNCEYVKKLFLEGITEKAIEYRSYQPDGMLHWVRAVCNIMKDKQSRNIIAYVYFYDIDMQKKAQLVQDCVVKDEIDFVVLYNVHKNVARFIKMKQASDSVLQSDYKLFQIADVDGKSSFLEEEKPIIKKYFNYDTIKQKLEKESVATATYGKRMEDGTIRRKIMKAFYLDNTHDDIVLVRRDISDLYEEEQRQKQTLRAAANEAIRANRAKSDFLSRMSHDMRTPLNGILGLAMLMKERIHDDSVLQDLSQMQISGQYLLNLINDTLDVSRIENGKLELHPSVCEGKSIYDNVLSLGRTTVDAKHINLEVNTSGLKYPLLYIDVGRVEQIILNIVGNAAKFTAESGHIVCTISNESFENGIITDKVSIKDDGIGMSKEFLEHIFEPFSQADSSKKNSNQGTGLGMSITKQLVELMGGTISVESELGKGTCVLFTLVMPVATNEQIDEWKKLNNAEHEYGKLNGKYILMCEDHPLNAKIAIRLLTQKGIIVDHAKNGKEGLEMFKSSAINQYDAILMDIRMPVMDGLETATAIRKLRRTDSKTIPIIAMTANALDEDVKATKKVGMNAHLSKPIEPLKLYDTLKDFLCR